MADLSAQIANEKLKGIALMLRNGAVLLATAAVGRISIDGIDLYASSWLAGAGVMIYVGTEMLTLLQSEDGDG